MANTSKIFNELNKRSAQIEKETMRQLRGQYQRALDDTRGKLANLNGQGVLNPAAMAERGRLANLEKFINERMARVKGESVQATGRGLTKVMKQSVSMTRFGIEDALQSRLSFGVFDEEAAKAAIENDYALGKWREAAQLNGDQAAKRMRDRVTQGIIQGQDYDTLARGAAEEMGVALNKADRVVRTESHRARETGKLRTMKEAEDLGVKQKKRWIATLDGATRDSHQELDGKTIPVDKDFEGEFGSGPAPGQMGSAQEDINCRCTMITVIEDFEPENRRDKEGMKEYKDYDEWANNQKREPNVPETQEPIRDVRRRLRDEKNMDWQEPKFKPSGIPEDIREEQLRQVDYLSRRYDLNKFGQRETMRFMPKNMNSLGQTGFNYQKPVQNMYFSPRYFNDRDTMIKQIQDDISVGYATKVSPDMYSRYVVTHEYGHMVQNKITHDYLLQDKGYMADMRAAAQGMRGPDPGRYLRQEWLEPYRRNMQEEILERAAKETGKDVTTLYYDQVSNYGKTEPAEFFAETFASLEGGEPNDLARAMEGWLKDKGVIKE